MFCLLLGGPCLIVLYGSNDAVGVDVVRALGLAEGGLCGVVGVTFGAFGVGPGGGFVGALNLILLALLLALGGVLGALLGSGLGSEAPGE